VFVAPATRVPVLAYELALRLAPVGQAPHAFGVAGESHVTHLASGKALVVTSWTVLLASVGTAMETAGEFDNLADLRQLQALVVRMDKEGFRPFSVTDLTADTPRLILRLCGLIDSVAQQLLTRPHVSRKGLRASAGQGWYGHYLKVHGFGCQLIVSAKLWAEHGLSPIWFRVSDSGWKFSESLHPLLAPLVPEPSWLVEDRTTGWQGLWQPLRILEGREREAVVTDLLRQVEAIAAVLSADEQPERDVEPEGPPTPPSS
jgi:hypothetical protein